MNARKELEDAYADAFALGDEILLLEGEGKEVPRAKARYELAKRNFIQALPGFLQGDLLSARAKLKSALRMIELTREEISSL